VINLEYEKIYRVTVPSGGAKLTLISIKLDANVSMIVEKILKVKNQYF